MFIPSISHQYNQLLADRRFDNLAKLNGYYLDIIHGVIRRVAEENNITIVHASIVGSWLYSVNTSDSDIDVRVIYHYPLESYLSVDRDKHELKKGLHPDKITVPNIAKAGNITIDIQYMELRHALKLMLESNYTVLEMIMSQCIDYHNTPEWPYDSTLTDLAFRCEDLRRYVYQLVSTIRANAKEFNVPAALARAIPNEKGQYDYIPYLGMRYKDLFRFIRYFHQLYLVLSECDTNLFDDTVSRTFIPKEDIAETDVTRETLATEIAILLIYQLDMTREDYLTPQEVLIFNQYLESIGLTDLNAMLQRTDMLPVMDEETRLTLNIDVDRYFFNKLTGKSKVSCKRAEPVFERDTRKVVWSSDNPTTFDVKEAVTAIMKHFHRSNLIKQGHHPNDPSRCGLMEDGTITLTVGNVSGGNIHVDDTTI